MENIVITKGDKSYSIPLKYIYKINCIQDGSEEDEYSCTPTLYLIEETPDNIADEFNTLFETTDATEMEFIVNLWVLFLTGYNVTFN